MTTRKEDMTVSPHSRQDTSSRTAIGRLSTLSTVLLYLMCAWPTLVCAELAINKAIVPFDSPFEQSRDIEVINTSSTDILYVDVEVMQVLNPGGAQELHSTRGSDDPGLVATPAKLAVPPGSRQVVRIMNIKPTPDQERVYRINFTPVYPPLAPDDTLTKTTTQTAVQIIVAYQALVLIPPVEPEAIVEYQREGQSVLFANSGNANVLLRRGRQCDPTDSTVCVDLTTRRVYPGGTIEFEVPFEGSLSFTLQSQGKIEKREFL